MEEKSKMITAKCQGERIAISYTEATEADAIACQRLIGSMGSPARSGAGATVQATPASAAKLLSADTFEVNASAGVEMLADLWDEGLRAQAMPEKYRSSTEPWAHQLDAFRFAYSKQSALLALEMGCGKSKVAIDLLTAWESKTVLIVCPKSVLGVWSREFAAHYPDDYSIRVMDSGTGKKKASVIESLIDLDGEACRVVVINYESLISKPVAAVCTRKWDAIILDESHKIKAPTGKTSKMLFNIGKRARHKLCLTGTPMPHSPLDLFGQFRFLDCGIFGTSWVKFRSRYAVSHPRFPNQIQHWQNQDELADIFNTLAFRVKASQVLDLPEAHHIKWPVTLSKTGAAVYKDIETDLISDVTNGTVTVTNALTRLLRLQQITSGHIKTDDGLIASVCDSKRLAMREIVEGIDLAEPVVVFCKFTSDLDAVKQLAKDTGRRYGEISGRRKDLTDTGDMPDDVKLMAVQIQAGGCGIDLTLARFVIYYSIGFSLGDYEQSLARVHRPTQSRSVTYWHLSCAGTVDDAVYRALRNRKDLVTSVMEELGSAT